MVNSHREPLLPSTSRASRRTAASRLYRRLNLRPAEAKHVFLRGVAGAPRERGLRAGPQHRAGALPRGGGRGRADARHVPLRPRGAPRRRRRCSRGTRWAGAPPTSTRCSRSAWPRRSRCSVAAASPAPCRGCGTPPSAGSTSPRHLLTTPRSAAVVGAGAVDAPSDNTTRSGCSGRSTRRVDGRDERRRPRRPARPRARRAGARALGQWARRRRRPRSGRTRRSARGEGRPRRRRQGRRRQGAKRAAAAARRRAARAAALSTRAGAGGSRR